MTKKTTLAGNLIGKLKDMEDIGVLKNKDSSEVNREIAMPIPVELLTEEHPDILKFVEIAGKINRDKSLNLPVEQENDSIPTPDGNMKVFVLVFKYNKNTNVNGVIKLFEEA